MMKHVFFFFLMVSFSKGQLVIGKSEVDGSSTILDFKGNTTSGLISPWVTSLDGEKGTLIFDVNDKKVKYFTTSWVNLSPVGTQENTYLEGQVNLVEIQTNQGVILGSTSSSQKGVLVLESKDKAMILPKIASPHLNVKVARARHDLLRYGIKSNGRL